MVKIVHSCTKRFWAWLLLTDGSTTEQAARGIVWLLSGEVVTRASALLKFAFLGRLLSPADFGLVGTALLLLQWFGSFTQTGFDAALINRRSDIRPYLDSIWTVQIIRGCVVAFALAAFAQPISRLMGSPQAAPFIQAVSVEVIIYGFNNPGVIYFRKELAFRREFIWRLGGPATGLLVGVAVGLIYRNAWALAASVLAARLVETALSYVAHPYRPKLALNWSAIRDIIPFSRWIAATNIVVFLEAQLDNIVVARFLGTRAFGLYQGAVQTAQTPLSQLGVIAGGVLFPAFCRSGNQERLRAGFMTSLALLLYCGLPLLAFLVCYTDTIIPFLAGEQWLPMCSAVRLLAVAGLCKALMSISQALLLAQGQPHTSFLTGAFRFAGLIALLALIFPRQITGVAVAVAIANAFVAFVQLCLAVRSVGIGWRTGLMSVRPGLLCALPILCFSKLNSYGVSPTLACTLSIAIWVPSAWMVGKWEFRNVLAALVVSSRRVSLHAACENRSSELRPA